VAEKDNGHIVETTCRLRSNGQPPDRQNCQGNLSACLTEQFNGGEQDQQRLTVLGLTYLRGVDRGL
jgi:hypothetical protein